MPPTLDEAGLKEYGCEIVTTACFDQVGDSSGKKDLTELLIILTFILVYID